MLRRHDRTLRQTWAEAGRERVNLELFVEPGPGVEIAFEGLAVPRLERRRIAALYRSDPLAERASLEEMSRQTVRALYGQGWLDPIQPPGRLQFARCARRCSPAARA